MMERQDHLYQNNRPTKVEDQIQMKRQNEPKSQAASAWNKAGTWEDRDLPAEVFQKALEQFWARDPSTLAIVRA